MSQSKVLLTGAAGAIGKHVCELLLAQGRSVIGIDNLNDYYAPSLKRDRIQSLSGQPSFRFEAMDIADTAALTDLFERERPEAVVHLAAQAGVRYALNNPHSYTASNLVGTANILELCRQHEVRHLVFASSSSVYGGNVKVPFSERDPVDHPVSYYAATKRATEVMAHSYAHLFSLPVTALRYFTVYGPWGRPDMAVWKFTEALFRGQTIDVYGKGLLARDFTYVDDAARATIAVLERPPARQSSANPADWRSDVPDSSWAPFEIYNVGRSDPVTVNDFLAMLERHSGRTALRRDAPLQPGDVERTFADCSKIHLATGWQPQVSVDEGLARFVAWFRAYHRIGQ